MCCVASFVVFAMDVSLRGWVVGVMPLDRSAVRRIRARRKGRSS